MSREYVDEGLEEGEIDERTEALANTGLPIGLRGRLDGRVELTKEEAEDDIGDIETLFLQDKLLEDNPEEDFIQSELDAIIPFTGQQLSKIQLEHAYSLIMTKYKVEEDMITMKLTDLQKIMEELFTKSRGLHGDLNTQVVPQSNLTESEMIKYVLPQIFQMFGLVNMQLNLLNVQGQTIQASVKEVRDTTERTEKTAKRTEEAVAGAAIGIQATLDSFRESLNEMKTNIIVKLEQNTIMKRMMDTFSFVITLITKTITFIIQTRSWIWTSFTTFTTPIFGLIINYFFYILFFFIEFWLIVASLEYLVAQLGLVDTSSGIEGAELNYILQQVDKIKSMLYKLIRGLNIFKWFYSKMKKYIYFFFKLLNLPELYEICENQFSIAMKSLYNITMTMMIIVRDEGLKGIKEASVKATQGFTYATSAARYGLAQSTSFARERILQLKQDIGSTFRSALPQIFSASFYGKSKSNLQIEDTTQASQRKKPKQPKQKEEYLPTQEDITGEASKSGLFKQPRKKYSQQRSYITPQEPIIAQNPTQKLDIQENKMTDIFGNIFSNTSINKMLKDNELATELDDDLYDDDEEIYLTGKKLSNERFAESFTSQTGKKVKERISSILEFERKKIEEIYKKSKVIVYNTYVFVSEISSQGASNFFSLVPSISLQDMLSVILRTPPEIFPVEEESISQLENLDSPKYYTPPSNPTASPKYYTPPSNPTASPKYYTPPTNRTVVSKIKQPTCPKRNRTESSKPKHSVRHSAKRHTLQSNRTASKPNKTISNTSDVVLNIPADNATQVIQANPIEELIGNTDEWVVQGKPIVASPAEQERARNLFKKKPANPSKPVKSQPEEPTLFADDNESILNRLAEREISKSDAWSIPDKPVIASLAEQERAKNLFKDKGYKPPKKGWFNIWGGGNDKILNNNIMFTNYDLIFEPIFLSLEIISLSLLTQYSPTIATLPYVISNCNSYIQYQNIIYKSVQKEISHKYTRRNTIVLKSKRTINKRRSANKGRRTVSKRNASKIRPSKVKSMNKKSRQIMRMVPF
jgi:hypothetical protein